MIKFTGRFTKLLSYLQFRVDTTRFFFDKPSFDYQPIPTLGIKSAGIRGKATVDRWSVIKKTILKSDKSMKDIGSCVGYFCIASSHEFGLTSIGIDMNSQFIRISEYATPEKLRDKCMFLNMPVNVDTVKILPKTDITLCLSIWHHWIFHFGLKNATKILQSIWESTNREMFFESGEEEVKEEFNLPFKDGELASIWLKRYLETNLKNSKVEIVAKYPAGDYAHYKIKGNKRSLFKITHAK